MKVFGIIGYPLDHSFSQKYFTEKFQREGIQDCVYRVYPIPAIAALKELVQEEHQLQGLNITIPYKQAILPFVDDITNIPAGLNACNCIKIIGGRIIGYNTDITGFEGSLLPQLKSYHTKALILGGGGAAAAVKFVLNKLGISFTTVSRRSGDAAVLTYPDLDETVIREHLLIINTTPLGTFPGVHECPDIPYQYLTPQHFLYDLIYNPGKTLFLQKGEACGSATRNGHEMLVIQAEESWRIWNEA